MKKRGICLTSAGNLHVKKVIHLDAPQKEKEWSVLIRRCLKEAELYALNSVAFPALGTG